MWFPVFVLSLNGCGTFQNAVLENERRVNHVIELQERVSKSVENLAKADVLQFNEALDLYELLNIAFENHPQAKIAWHQALESAAAKLKTDSAFYPHVDVSVNAVRAEQLGSAQKVGDSVRMTTATSNMVYPEISVSYSLFKFGAHKAESQAALNSLEAANFRFNQTLQDIALKVELAYFNLDSALATVDANRQNLEDAQVALDAANDRHASGLANKQDVLKAQAAYSAAVYDLENSKSAVETVRANLAAAIGVNISKNLRITRVAEEKYPEVDDVEKVIQEAVARRQDILAQEKTLDAQVEKLNARRRDQYPEIVAGLTASRKKIQHVNGAYNNFNAYIGVKWNLFDGYSQMADRLMAYENVKVAQLQLKSKVIDVTSQVWEHFFAYQSAAHKLDAAKESERCAEESFNYTREAYRNGLCSFTDLLTSQNALSLARRQLVCAKNDLSIEWMQLAYSTGKILEK